MNDDLHLILAQYADEAGHIPPAQLWEMTQRYPRFAEEIVEYAVNDFVFEQGATYATDAPASEARFLARAAAIQARMRAAQPQPRLVSLLEAGKARGLAPAALANALKLGMPELTKLDRRLLRAAGIPKRLVTDLSHLLQRPFAEIAAYLRQPATLSMQASYRADQAPRLAGQEEFSATLEASRSLTEEQKRFWRAEMDETLGE